MALLLSTVTKNKVISCDVYTSSGFYLFFFFLPNCLFYKTSAKTQKNSTATASNCSYFVPFPFVQTFYGLSTWVTFSWCSTAIFVSTVSNCCIIHCCVMFIICLSPVFILLLSINFRGCFPQCHPNDFLFCFKGVLEFQFLNSNPLSP